MMQRQSAVSSRSDLDSCRGSESQMGSKSGRRRQSEKGGNKGGGWTRAIAEGVEGEHVSSCMSLDPWLCCSLISYSLFGVKTPKQSGRPPKKQSLRQEASQA